MHPLNRIPSWVHDDHLVFLYQSRNISETINWQYFNTVIENIKTITFGKEGMTLPNISICPVYSLNGKTYVLQKGTEYSIIFDCFHGGIIKQILQLIISGSSQDQIFPLLKEIVAARLLNRGYDELAFAVQDETISRLFGRSYYNQEESFRKAAGLFLKLPKMPIYEVAYTIDYYIIAHEVFHCLESEDHETFEKYTLRSQSLLDFIYEKFFSPSKGYQYYLDRMKQELGEEAEFLNEEAFKDRKWQKERKLYFEGETKSLRDEIAADLFAADKAIRMMWFEIDNRNLDWKVESIYSIAYLISEVFYLYISFTERADSFANGEENRFSSIEHSSMLRMRNWILSQHIVQAVESLSWTPRLLKRFNLTTETRLSWQLMYEQISAIKNYLDEYIHTPSYFPIEYTLKSARAKLQDITIGEIYKNAATDFDMAAKARYIGPIIENFALVNYFTN